MAPYEQIVSAIALSMGVAWASGINLYAAILVLGWLSATGNMTLPPEMSIVTHPMVLLVAGVMFCIEFFADKVPGVDSAWDVLHTFIRIPAGAVLAASAVGDVSPALSLAAGLVGGGVALTTHATKSGSRVLINSSPEPFSNWTASVVEDLLVIGAVWSALYHPWIFLLLFAGFVGLAIWLLPKLWNAICVMFGRIRAFLTSSRKTPTTLPNDDTEA